MRFRRRSRFIGRRRGFGRRVRRMGGGRRLRRTRGRIRVGYRF